MQIETKLIQTNFKKGRSEKIRGVIIHTEGPTAEIKGTADRDLYNWFNNPTAQVSAHYNILFSGKIVQFVKDENTAWHAGPGENGRTIGIEMQDNGRWNNAATYTNAQYQALAELLINLHYKHGIRVHHGLDGIRPHREISNRACPGKFDWERAIREAWAIDPKTNPDYVAPIEPPKPITHYYIFVDNQERFATKDKAAAENFYATYATRDLLPGSRIELHSQTGTEPYLIISEYTMPTPITPVQSPISVPAYTDAGKDLATALGYSLSSTLFALSLIDIAIIKDPSLGVMKTQLIIIAVPTVNLLLVIGKKLYQKAMAKLN